MGKGDVDTAGLALEQLRTLFDYSIWARDRLLGPIEALDEDKLRQGGQSGVYGSIFETLAHMAASEWLWLQRCDGQSPMRSPRGEDFAGLRALIDWWNDVHAGAMLYIDNLSPDGLFEEVTYSAADGKVRTRKVWHMLLQVPNHQTEHRSQIATMLGMLSVEVPQTDLVVYLSEKRA